MRRRLRNAGLCLLALSCLATSSRAQELLAQEPLENKAAYQIAPDDVLDVTVLGETELSKVVTVLPSGEISYPYFGHANVAGLTPEELERRLATSLQAALLQPQVTVSVRERRVRQVSVLGAVKLPGRRPIKEGWRVLDALADAGGLSTARPEWVQAVLVQKAGTQTTPLDMVRLLAAADPEENRLLEPDDLLLIQELDASRTQVQVLGEVTRPGLVAAPKDGSLSAVLTAAGGPTAHAALSRATLLRGSRSIALDLRGLMDGSVAPETKIEAGDTLVLPANRRQFAVFGAVHSPGVLDFPEGEPLTVLNALTRAGGANADAELKSATVVRALPDGKASNTTVNLDNMLKKGDLAGNLTLQPGDVLYIPTHKAGTPFRWTDLFPVVSLLDILGRR